MSKTDEAVEYIEDMDELVGLSSTDLVRTIKSPCNYAENRKWKEIAFCPVVFLHRIVDQVLHVATLSTAHIYAHRDHVCSDQSTT